MTSSSRRSPRFSVPRAACAPSRRRASSTRRPKSGSIASHASGAACATLTLVDDHRHFWKSAIGLPEPWASRREAPLTHALCQYVVTSGEMLVVEDAGKEAALSASAAARELGVIAYMGIPIETAEHIRLGALSVSDFVPRAFDAAQRGALRDLAACVAVQIELSSVAAEMRTVTGEHRALLDASRAAVWSVDRDLRLTSFNARAAHEYQRHFGFVMELGLRIDQLLPPERAPGMRALHERALRGEQLAVETLEQGEQGPREVRLTVAPVFVEGAIQGATVLAEDISEELRVERSLRRQSALFNAVSEHLSEGLIVTDITGTPVIANTAAALMVGERASASTGALTAARADSAFAGVEMFLDEGTTACPADALPANRALRGERLANVPIFMRSPRHPEGRWHELSGGPVHDDDGCVLGSVLIGRDVTEQRTAEHQLQHMTAERDAQMLLDPLTGIYNCRGLALFGERLLRHAQREQRGVLVLIANVTGMKSINEQLGFDEGDRALKDLAGVLHTTLRETDLVARLGGDTFAAMATVSREAAEVVIARVHRALASHNQTVGRRYPLSVSIGTAHFDPADAVALPVLLGTADEALDHERRRRSGRKHTAAEAGADLLAWRSAESSSTLLPQRAADDSSQ